MTVRFKFRSSVGFDSVEINGRPWISVRDLRSKIVQKTNLRICDDFDLVISDANTNTIYDDEDFSVPDGSSVIIKRVPSQKPAPSDLLCTDSENRVVTKHGAHVADVEVENFDDFGADLCPAPEASLDSDLDTDKRNCVNSGRKDEFASRCLELYTKVPNNEPSDLSQAVPKGNQKKHSDETYCAEGVILEEQPQSRKEMELKEEVGTNNPMVVNVDLPAELRCSLCNMIFKEAVMIPCCQHSFCNKCIRSVLVEREKCPKCSSAKCRVEDLLPNVSLRQAIEHFLESQALISGSDNLLPKYAPDGESGIQVREVSCAVSIHQRGPPLPHSPSATGNGSNQVVADSAWESHVRNNGTTSGPGSRIIQLNMGKCGKLSSSTYDIKTMKDTDENDVAVHAQYFESAQERVESTADFQKEANLTSMKKKGLWVNPSDGSGSFITTRYRKGDRTCYMCGSPDHLVRDCPATSSPYPMLPTGDAMFHGGNLAYAQPYWQGASLPHLRPYGNMYCTPGMMPFDTPMVPVTPFTVPPYMPSMYPGMPMSCGFVRMGGAIPPSVGGVERPLSRTEFMELQERERRRKLSDELDRGHAYDSDDYSSEVHRRNEVERKSSDCKLHPSGAHLNSCSDDQDRWRQQNKWPSEKRTSDSLPHRISDFNSGDEVHSVGRKSGKGSHFSDTARDSKAHYSDKSKPERHMSDSSTRHSKDRHRHHHSSSKVYDERTEQCVSESSDEDHHRQKWKETSDHRNKAEVDVKKSSHKHSYHSEVGLESNTSTDQKRHWREKESKRASRHSKNAVKAADDADSGLDRWEMVDGLDHDEYEGYRYHKRRRNH